MNTYAYVFNSPLRYIDPTGEAAFICGIWPLGTAACVTAVTVAAVFGTKQCTEKTIGFCERQFPNHMTDPIQKRGLVNCMAKASSGAGQFAGAVTGPVGTAASTIGGAIGTEMQEKCDDGCE